MQSNDLLTHLESQPKCKSCAIRDAKKVSQFHLSGMFALDCPICAAHLVLSARPSRQQQNVMLASIARARNAPTQEAVMREIQKIKENEQVDLFP